MLHSDSVAHPTNGAAEALDPPPLQTCPLENLPKEVHQYLHALETRIANLETAIENFNAAQEKNRERMKGLGKIVMSGPGKMLLAALPKDRQKELQEFFGE